MDAVLDEKRLTPSQWVKKCERKADEVRYRLNRERDGLKALHIAATAYRQHRKRYRKDLAAGRTWGTEAVREQMQGALEAIIHKPYWRESIHRRMAELSEAYKFWIEMLNHYQATVKPKPAKVDRTKLQQRFDKLYAGYVRECKRAKVAITQTIENGYVVFKHAHGTFQLKQVA